MRLLDDFVLVERRMIARMRKVGMMSGMDNKATWNGNGFNIKDIEERMKSVPCSEGISKIVRKEGDSC